MKTARKTMSNSYCDIHQHIVYGVDDGAEDFEMAVKMLKIAANEGTSDIICTSHVSGRNRLTSRSRYDEHLVQLQSYADENGIEITLHKGNEILFSEDIIALIDKGIAYTLDCSDKVLVEFVPYTPFQVLEHAAILLYNEGLIPVFAHVERYDALRDLDNLRKLRENYGVIAQMNSSTVVSSKGLFGNRWSKNALKASLIDAIGSDAHNITTRKPGLNDAYEVLVHEYGEKKANKLCRGTGELILNG